MTEVVNVLFVRASSGWSGLVCPAHLFGTNAHISLLLRRSTSNNLRQHHDVTLPTLLVEFRLSGYWICGVVVTWCVCFLDTLGRGLCHPISGELNGTVRVPRTTSNEIANSHANGIPKSRIINIFVDFPRWDLHVIRTGYVLKDLSEFFRFCAMQDDALWCQCQPNSDQCGRSTPGSNSGILRHKLLGWFFKSINNRNTSYLLHQREQKPWQPSPRRAPKESSAWWQRS